MQERRADWTCLQRYPACGCPSWARHLELNPCIEELGRLILADQKRKGKKGPRS